MKILIIDDSLDQIQEPLELLLRAKYGDEVELEFIESASKFFQRLPDLNLQEIGLILLDQTLDRVNMKSPQGKEVFQALVESDPTIKDRILSISDNKTSVDYLPEDKIIGKPMEMSGLTVEEYMRVGGRYMKKLPDSEPGEFTVK